MGGYVLTSLISFNAPIRQIKSELIQIYLVIDYTQACVTMLTVLKKLS